MTWSEYYIDTNESRCQAKAGNHRSYEVIRGIIFYDIERNK